MMRRVILALRRRWLVRGRGGLLARHHAGEGFRRCAAGIHARSRQRRSDVLRRRLQRLPRHAGRGRQDQARRRHGAEIAVTAAFYPPNISPDPQRRHRRLERGRLRHRDVEGHVAGRAALLPGVSLSVLPAHEARRRARPVRLSQDAAAGAGQGARSRRARFRSIFAAWSAAGSFSISTASRSRPTRDNRRSGIAAPIWSTRPGHCAECHSPRNALGGIVEAQRFAGGPNPDGEGWVPNITQAGIGDYSVEDIEEILDQRADAGRRLGRRRDGRGDAQHRAAFRRRIARRWRPTSSRCRRSKGRSRPKPNNSRCGCAV